MMIDPDKQVWIEHYRCGCSSVAKTRRELLGYCATHGEEWIDRYSPSGRVYRKADEAAEAIPAPLKAVKSRQVV